MAWAEIEKAFKMEKTKRDFPFICDVEACTGCMACLNACRQSAIIMQQDMEGFLRPSIDDDKCVNCKQCIRICPANTSDGGTMPIGAYSGWSRDEHTRMRSSSGGAFFEIAKVVLSKNGVVFGCALNDKQQAYHTYVTDVEGLSAFQGSKYVQSYIGDSYSTVKKFLDEQRDVLFSGTPCQVAGLQHFLHKKYERLYTVDIVCHGVPSPMVFEDYKRFLEQKEESEIKNFRFRDKQYSWFFFNTKVVFRKNTAYIGTYYEDPYLRGFLRDLFLRPSCHHCQYTSLYRQSDFTLADWWGYKKKKTDDKDYFRKGVNLILVNSEKAQRILDETNMCLHAQSLEDAKKTNKCFSSSFPVPSGRAQFWKDYHSIPFYQLIQKYMYPERNTLIGNKILNKHVNSEPLLFCTRQLNRFHRLIRKILR